MVGVNKANCYLDGVIINPTLYLDDKLVIENGRVLLKKKPKASPSHIKLGLFYIKLPI
mgnify:CR=1 FL=1